MLSSNMVLCVNKLYSKFPITDILKVNKKLPKNMYYASFIIYLKVWVNFETSGE